jgi:hypothetical protein
MPLGRGPVARAAEHSAQAHSTSPGRAAPGLGERLPAVASGGAGTAAPGWRRAPGVERRLAVVDVQSLLLGGGCRSRAPDVARGCPLRRPRRAPCRPPASARLCRAPRSRHVAIASWKRLRLDRASPRARAPTTPTTRSSAPDNCVASFEIARIARVFHALRSSGFPGGSALRAPAWHARCSKGIGLRRGCHPCLEPNAAAVIERRASAP